LELVLIKQHATVWHIVLNVILIDAKVILLTSIYLF